MSEVTISDLYTLAALRARGVHAVRCASDGRRASWTFSDTRELRSILEEYYGRRMSVDALTFAELLRSAKGEALHVSRA